MSRQRSSAALKVNEAVPVFAALADPTRLRLIGRLAADGPLSITRLSEDASVTRQAITRHLETLGEAGLVRDTRHGRERVFALDLKRLEKAKQYLDLVSAQWDDVAARLKAFVEENP
ncbi:MAG TPA: metalloregulator ArsR/SmtB family transcription factor [Gemmatimonadaceae bacterium]|nr:metalloregulator ArsR/SmtB family transcription factor [Gemmatimonadaceae bacterium]